MNNMVSKIAIWVVIGLVLFSLFRQFEGTQTRGVEVSYSQFMEEAKQGRIRSAVIDGRTVRALTTDDRSVTINAPQDLWMVSDLMKYGVSVSAKAEEQPSLLMSIFVSWFPMLLLIGVWVFFMRQMQGGGKGGAFSFGKSKARMLDENNNHITFADVAGCDEAKEDVSELVEFLRDPSKFQKLGGRIPRGVLMVGSPGTGKTLLAKAIAGEAKVPFFSISGSDFVEMFVGVGAARVRDMFENAKKQSPCIIFIDEIDAVGRQRGAGLGGGNDEREQTLNQMLVEMDGFETNQGIIVIAATNRPDVLDPALLRPGRFDRQVVVPLPDVRGREQILNVHMRKVPISPDVKADILARGTPGMSGADLANLVNEAASLRPVATDGWSRWTTSKRPRTRSSWVPSDAPLSCPRKSARTPPTTSPGTPSSPACCPRPTRSTRSPSFLAAAHWVSPCSSPRAIATAWTKSACSAPSPCSLVAGLPKKSS